MFILKKIISQFLFPVSLSLEFSLAGLFFLWFTGKQRTGKILVSIGLIFMLLISYSAISDQLLRPFESKYEPYTTKSSDERINSPQGINPKDISPDTSKSPDERINSPQGINPKDISPVKFVVVLGSGHISDPKLPLTSQLDEESLARLIEGIRIYRKHRGSKLILSGGQVFDPIPNAELMAGVAGEIGIPKNDIILESQSRDTQDEARLIKLIVHHDRFILVTSASHLPRSIAMFKKLGMQPVPAPAGHLVKDEQGCLSPWSFFPSAKSIYKAERAFYEYLGTAWAKLRGQIQD